MATKKKRPPEVKAKLKHRSGPVRFQVYFSHSEHYFPAELATAPTRNGEEKQRSLSVKSVRFFNGFADFLDLALEPDAAEEAIGNLAEMYAQRLALNPRHAKRWLVAQVAWIVWGRAIDVFRQFMRARAGK